jgi:phosphoglycerol transferase MdoB-like AlkP superfamily enzyme
MVFYSPKHLAPQRIDALTTQIDIAPTVLGLLGLPYEAPFFGQDVLHTPAEHRVAFFSHNHDVAIYQGNTLAILGLGKSIENVTYDRATDTYKPAPSAPKLNDLGVAYYQTAYELFHAHRYE